MTRRERAHLEHRLLEERERARRIAGRPSGIYPALSAEIARILDGIDEALAALYGAPGRFGRCVACGDAIAFQRLSLLPWAHNCRRCEAVAERRSATGPASPRLRPSGSRL